MTQDAALKGRVALVTGSAHGLGRGMALALGRHGADVAVHYRTRKQEAEQLAAEIRGCGVQSGAFRADLCSWHETTQLIETVHQLYRRIDILVNNVGPFLQKSFAEMEPVEWSKMVDGNLNTTYHASRAVWPIMIKQNYGRIINIGLANADQVQAYRTIIPYAIAKTGVLILCKSLAMEGAAYGITVNVLAPGLMDNGDLSAEERARLAEKIPAGRAGTDRDLIAALLFLTSDEASYITGAQIPVSGGWGL